MSCPAGAKLCSNMMLCCAVQLSSDWVTNGRLIENDILQLCWLGFYLILNAHLTDDEDAGCTHSSESWQSFHT